LISYLRDLQNQNTKIPQEFSQPQTLDMNILLNIREFYQEDLFWMSPSQDVNTWTYNGSINLSVKAAEIIPKHIAEPCSGSSSKRFT